MNRPLGPRLARNPGPLSPRKAPLALLMLTALGAGQSARAQSAPLPPESTAAAEPAASAASSPARAADGSKVDQLDVVTVTATRRREPVREVPMQVTALQGESLERAGDRTLGDYIADQPGVNIAGSGAVGGSLSIRGLTTGVQTSATVGVYVDDVATGSSAPYALGQSTPLNMGLLDLNHIEILRGPQGTLYGAGAMGGVLKYVTNEPDTSAFSGKVRLDTSSTQGGGTNYTASAVINVPIKEDVAAIRVAAFHDHFGGYYDAVGPAAANNVDRGDTDGGRISLLLMPSRDLSIRLTAMTQDMRRDGSGAVDLNPATGQPLLGGLTHQLYLAQPLSDRVTLYGLDIEYDMGWARLNSITSVQDVSIHQTSDVTSTFGPLLNAAGLPVQTAALTANVPQHRLSQEFRLTSRASHGVEWLAGIYLNRERGNQAGGADATLSGGLGSINLLTSELPSTYRELAAYGDVTWHATPALSLTGGLRFSRNHQTYADTSSGLLVGTPSMSGGHSDENRTTYLATAAYALNPTSNVYFRAASGYRPGGPNGLKADTPTTIVPPSFRSDSLWSYEFGYKADLLDRTLTLEAAVYDIEWRDIQQSVQSGNFSFYTNGGNARVRGSELVLNWSPTREWRFTGTAAAIDAQLTTEAPGIGAAAGTRLPVTPRFSASFGATRSFSVAEHPAYAGISARYAGERDAGYPGSTFIPSYKLPAYTQFDLQAGIDFQRFSLAAYVRNATNRYALLFAGVSATAVEGVVLQPRTVGMSVNVPF